MSRPRCPATMTTEAGTTRCARHKGHGGIHGDGLLQWGDPPRDSATERADLLAWLDGDLPVDLDAYTVMRVREAVREGEHVGAASDSRAPNAASRV